MSAGLQFHGGVHIHHQLQLQPIVQRCQIKTPVPGFIVNHFHIYLIRIFRDIHPVDAPLESHLVLAGPLPVIPGQALARHCGLPHLLLRQGNIHLIQPIYHVKRNLMAVRHKIPLLQLMLQRPDRPFQDPAHAPYPIGTAGTGIEHTAAVLRRELLQRLLHGPVPPLPGKVKPGVAALFQPPCKSVQHLVERIAHIHIFKAEFFPFPQGQTVL